MQEKNMGHTCICPIGRSGVNLYNELSDVLDSTLKNRIIIIITSIYSSKFNMYNLNNISFVYHYHTIYNTKSTFNIAVTLTIMHPIVNTSILK